MAAELLHLAVLCIVCMHHALSQTCTTQTCGQFISGNACQCNTACETYNDCCDTYYTVCKGETCQNKCGASYNSNEPCQCNNQCKTYGNCCLDFTQLCETCENKCGASYDSSQACQCNDLCSNYGNCCDDYGALCNGETKMTLTHDLCSNYGNCCGDYGILCNGGSGTTSPPTTSAPGGGGGTPGNLNELMQALWDNDVNRVPESDITLDVNGQTLFSNVVESRLEAHTFMAFKSLLNNYNKNVGTAEAQTNPEQQEIEHFLNVILETKVMLLAKTYLETNGYVGTNTDDFRNLLKELWFNFYSRSSSSSTLDSSGFEHVMVGETRDTSVTGFHSWVQFYLEELAGNLEYINMVSESEPRIKAAKFNWYGVVKNTGSFFLGTSPEFDLAVYTVCAVTNTGSQCPFTLQGASVSIQTYDINHKNGNQIGSAYPIV